MQYIFPNRVKRGFFLTLLGLGAAFGWGCSSGGETPEARGSVTQTEKEVSGKIALALGGTAPGADIYLLSESPKLLSFTTDDEELLTLSVPSGFSSYTESRSVQIAAKMEGIGYFTPIVDTRGREPVQVTIPPQKLIQILIGEARGQIAREATLDDEDRVKKTSVSLTGDAVGAVIRNRIDLILQEGDPNLFEADTTRFQENPPVSYYEAVIEADGQFSPTEPEDPTHARYREAASRDDIRDDDDRIAYDQAVLTAADIFNGDTEDPTGGAFAFYSPTESQYGALLAAVETGVLDLPAETGVSDDQFPALAPIQVLILDDIASITTLDPRPAFVFVRERDPADPAVTDVP